jgi:transposase
MHNLIRGANGKMVFLIVDNLRVHNNKKDQEWLKKNFDKIKVFYLPTYCPDLNPDQYLNHLIKRISILGYGQRIKMNWLLQ